MAVEGEEKK